MMFTASKVQVATYLLGVCPFSIAFLVFLNSSVSFVITDLIGREDGVGDAVGNLGFADELLALVACPLWGLLSDKIGVRYVCVMGYLIIALALVLFVQAQNVYPQLLLGRIFFSLGGAAASTMVTAILPSMSFRSRDNSTVDALAAGGQISAPNGHTNTPSITSELTITPARYHSSSSHGPQATKELTGDTQQSASAAKIAGFVGMFTGCGALLALGVFLPLPARFQKTGISPGQALQFSYYIVAGFAFGLAVVCFVGLRRLQIENGKGGRAVLGTRGNVDTDESSSARLLPSWRLLYQALVAGFQRADIGLGYLGGFVARASSVGISLFIPLLVNALFSSSGLCSENVSDTPTGLPDLKRRCPRAYVVAAELTGVSQFVALCFAPVFGYLSARYRNAPLVFASAAGIIGYPLFAKQFSPNDADKGKRAIAFFAVCLIGISQIGAIVCSLSSLSNGVLREDTRESDKSSTGANTSEALASTPENGEPAIGDDSNEHAGLLNGKVPREVSHLADFKGSVAGIYSFYGGAAILVLTKLGGSLFDKVSTGAPFYIMASFNACLFLACLSSYIKRVITSK